MIVPETQIAVDVSRFPTAREQRQLRATLKGIRYVGKNEWDIVFVTKAETLGDYPTILVYLVKIPKSQIPGQATKIRAAIKELLPVPRAD